MSYILEALANSEQARQQIAATPKYSLLPVVGENLPQKSRLPYAVAGVVLVNAMMFQVWLRPASTGGAESIKAPLAAATPGVPRPDSASPDRGTNPAAVATQANTEPQHAAETERVNVRRVTPPSGDAEPGPRTALAPPVLDSVPAALSRKEIASAQKPKDGASSQISGDALTELPLALQKSVPVLSVAGFIRDEGSSSMVIVNDRLVREGDEVAPGVKLEKIINDSLIFSYKGYRFKR